MQRHLNLIAAILLALSALAITVSGAFLSVKGLLIFIPDEALAAVIIALASAFEASKITASTFLFHRIRDKGFPWLFKAFLLFAICGTMFVSGIATYIHLTHAMTASNSEMTINSNKREKIEARISEFRTNANQIMSQISQVEQSKGSLASKTKFINNLTSERDRIQNEINRFQSELDAIDAIEQKDDKLASLNAIAKVSGIDKLTIFTFAILAIVSLIDPLAIVLFLAASYVFSEYVRQPKPQAEAILQTAQEIPVPIADEPIEQPIIAPEEPPAVEPEHIEIPPLEDISVPDEVLPPTDEPSVSSKVKTIVKFINTGKSTDASNQVLPTRVASEAEAVEQGSDHTPT